jgi:hypothetical protein
MARLKWRNNLKFSDRCSRQAIAYRPIPYPKKGLFGHFFRQADSADGVPTRLPLRGGVPYPAMQATHHFAFSEPKVHDISVYALHDNPEVMQVTVIQHFGPRFGKPDLSFRLLLFFSIGKTSDHDGMTGPCDRKVSM